MSEHARVTTWAHALIRMYLPPEWTFAFDNAKRRAGSCDHTNRRITLSRYLVADWSDDENHQTLLHEVAHAIAGPRAGHGPAWRAIADDLGYVGGSTHRGATADDIAPWRGACPAGHEVYRHRRPTRVTSCTRCSRSFDRRYLISWTWREITANDRRRAATAR